MITPDSPEAREEAIWMAFFDHLHDPERSNVLNREAENPAFEKFYRDHIRKLLAARGKRRYLSKGNYNITRLAYLHKLFPDARFVIPVRDPVWHIASLMKQHRLFCEGERGNHHALDYMRRLGHFEFGLDLRPINCGDSEIVREIEYLWRNGEEVRGWAKYWAMIYGHVAETLEADPALRKATMILRYEDLCEKPEETMKQLMTHCRLAASETVIGNFAERLKLPDYYRPAYSEDDLASIAELTEQVATRLSN